LHQNPEKDPGSGAEEENLGLELTGIFAAFDRFLEEVKATKEEETYSAYKADLNWVAKRLGKQFVSQVTRHAILSVIGKGREEGLNPKTVTRRQIVALMPLRNAGAVITLKKGNWPKITEKVLRPTISGGWKLSSALALLSKSSFSRPSSAQRSENRR
jgi:hypothetical protein